jgi:hypothetical protein
MKILGYGEDALTLWALEQRVFKILNECRDKTAISDCLVFYRPSFGRHSRAGSSIFGEFDAIIASKESIYLIESKWDNLTEFNNTELILGKEQTLRHKIFSWYLTHWNRKYLGNWQAFVSEHQKDFKINFKINHKTIAPKDSLLSRNLESILNKIQEHCGNISESSIKNILLFFFNSEMKSKPPIRINKTFKLIPIDYSREVKDNFITLFEKNQPSL